MSPAQTYGRDDDNSVLMYIEFGMAQKYVDDLSRNVKRGLKTKAEKGWYPLTPPPGYLINKVKLTGEVIIVADPERFPLVRRMWDLMLTGLYTPPRICEIANSKWGYRTRPTRKQGGTRLPRSSMYEIFTKPFYYGWYEFPQGSGQWIKGNHEPMISEREYERVQELLGRSGTPRSRTPRMFPFTGLIRCGGCNGMVTAEEKHQVICGNCRFKFAYRNRNSCPRCNTAIGTMKAPLFLHYTYYHCSKSKDQSCREKSVSAELLEQQIYDYLSRIQISDRFKQWAIKYLHALHTKERSFRTNVVQSQQKAYRECLRRMENLIALKTAPQNADGCLISDEEYSKQRMQLLRDKTWLEELLQNGNKGPEKWLELAETAIDLASTARQRFSSGDFQTKKEILSAIGSNLTLKGKKLSIMALEPFLILENIQDSSLTDAASLEPKNTGSTYGSNGDPSPPRPSKWAWPDDVRTYRQKAEIAARLIADHFKKQVLDEVWNGKLR